MDRKYQIPTLIIGLAVGGALLAHLKVSPPAIAIALVSGGLIGAAIIESISND